MKYDKGIVMCKALFLNVYKEKWIQVWYLEKRFFLLKQAINECFSNADYNWWEKCYLYVD